MNNHLMSSTPNCYIHQVSLINNLPDPNYDRNANDDYFVVDQNPRGYAKVVRNILE
jgi:hypothetical protein